MTPIKKTPLKVLVAQHRWWFPTYVSGADLANHEFARAMMRHGVDLRVYGISPPEKSGRIPSNRYQAEGVPVCLVTSNFLRWLAQEVKDFKPDVVLTSCPEPSCGADDITRMVDTLDRFDLPVVLYVHDIEGTLPLFRKSKSKLSAVVTNSNFMAGSIREIWGIDCEVVYPVPDWRSVEAGGSSGPFITFFNPTPHKGLRVAHSLVTRHLPERPFLFVEGFMDPEAHGISLVRSGNLIHARRSPDVATIYLMTRTLIVPSQWKEPFGRVAIEAMYNRIPVIASRTGGLVESVGEGGVLIDDFQRADRWAEAIKRLDEPRERLRAIRAGSRHVKRFSLDKEVEKLIRILRRAARRSA